MRQIKTQGFENSGPKQDTRQVQGVGNGETISKAHVEPARANKAQGTWETIGGQALLRAGAVEYDVAFLHER